MPSLLSLLVDPGAPPYLEMFLFLGATVLMLVLVVLAARKGKRRLHLGLALGTLPVLYGAIHYAGAMDAYWNFPKVPLRIHLSFAITATVLVFVVALSGFMHFMGWVPKKFHSRLAWIFLGFVLLASLTGGWIFLVGEPK
ncbi:MAG TPA: hypothetical protein ENK02_14675 [Planctomycetes bacterium]|nr:hypothetical protein [Planctomycetota bacterium]